eukprot:6456174-Amphidinium_carterae.1
MHTPQNRLCSFFYLQLVPHLSSHATENPVVMRALAHVLPFWSTLMEEGYKFAQVVHFIR